MGYMHTFFDWKFQVKFYMESDYDDSNVCVHLSPAYLSLINFLKVRNHCSPVVIADCCLQLYLKKFKNAFLGRQEMYQHIDAKTKSVFRAKNCTQKVINYSIHKKLASCKSSYM